MVWLILGKDCGKLNEPRNGKIENPDDTKHGDILKFSCDDGYDLTGDTTRECSDGVWQGSQPSCQSK